MENTFNEEQTLDNITVTGTRPKKKTNFWEALEKVEGFLSRSSDTISHTKLGTMEHSADNKTLVYLGLGLLVLVVLGKKLK